MSYLHIDNLYKAQEILLFKQCYALEKIHGTSTHISWNLGKLGFFSGGENHEKFCSLFNPEKLLTKFTEKFVGTTKVMIYGEGYGGKCQGMSKTYGKEFRFVAFDVRIDDLWISVPQALSVVTDLDLDFVPFELVSTDLDTLNSQRDANSIQAIKNGMGEGHLREGIVLRSLIEATLNNGKRIIAKHKREEFAERKTIPNIDSSRQEIMTQADAIANEWVTAHRLEHVLDKLRANNQDVSQIQVTGLVITSMIEDVLREAEGEIISNSLVKKAISAKTAKLFKKQLCL
jgi:hypothetical protein